jgi:hypothetical protein
LYERYKQRAEKRQRSIEDVVLEVVEEAAPEDEVPPEVENEVATFRSMSDKVLCKVARSRLPAKIAKKLNDLNYKQQKYGQDYLTQTERDNLEKLSFEYDKQILLRSYAASVLHDRGFDVSSLFVTNE